MWSGGDFVFLDLDATNFITEAGQVHHHGKELYMGSQGSGEAGHSVGTHARKEGWECRRWLGRLNPVNGNQGAYLGNEMETKKAGPSLTWAGKECGT